MKINDIILEKEEVRLDPNCWGNKKIGNPKTKMKGGVRVNNCVPKEAVSDDDSLKGFNPELQYAITKLKARYPHAEDLMSALLADVEKNEKDSDVADSTHEKRIADLEAKVAELAKEVTLDEDQDFHEEFGYLAYSIDESDLFEAEYQGRKVKLNKPMRGDVKKFKVYVKDPKTGNVKKVNFGHGGTSADRPTMRIRKSNPKARKSFRARHNCDNPGPKWKARYWSCKAW